MMPLNCCYITEGSLGISEGHYGIKFVAEDDNGMPAIALLYIPKGAHVFYGDEDAGYKCRADRAEVIAIGKFEASRDKRGDPVIQIIPIKKAASLVYQSTVIPFVYSVGRTVHPTSPFDKRLLCCASGIHYFTDAQNLMCFAYREGIYSDFVCRFTACNEIRCLFFTIEIAIKKWFTQTIKSSQVSFEE